MQNLIDKYQSILEKAVEAIHSRAFYSNYPEIPSGKIYGETANDDGLEAYKKQVGNVFSLLQNGENTASSEISPFTKEKLNISYPTSSVETYVNNAKSIAKAWRKISPLERSVILIDALEGVKNRFFELAYATMHTTGQGFMMAFQASGPHANDRALEAVAMAYHELTKYPENVNWVKPMGKFNLEVEKKYFAMPKGISLAIGCSTFPVWNSVPGIFASLATGNPVIVKPHPMAIYPLAIVVDEVQNALKRQNLDANIIQIAIDTPTNLITKDLAEHSDVKIIDYTGGSEFGDYIESIPGKTTFTEKAGVNSVILHSAKDLKAMVQNLAFSVSLYDGQMCTCPQNFYIPEDGIEIDGEKMSVEDFAAALSKGIQGLANHEKMGASTLGALQNPATYERAKSSQSIGGQIELGLQDYANEHFPNAQIVVPTVIILESAQQNVYEQELFGPIVFIIKTKNIEEAVQLAKNTAQTHGAITCGAYCTDEELQEYIADEMAEAYVGVAFNFTGFIWVNQSAAFSDFHVSGGNPAGNASLTDSLFVTKRFVWVGTRRVK